MLGGARRPATAPDPREAASGARRAADRGAVASSGRASETAASGRGRGAQFDEDGFLAAQGNRANSRGYACRAAAAAEAGTAPSWAERLRSDRDGAISTQRPTAAAPAASCQPVAAAAADALQGGQPSGRDRGGVATTADGAEGSDDGDIAMAKDGAEATATDGRIDDDDEDDVPPAATADELRRAWRDAAETVRFLERRGGPKVPAAVLEGARGHRDAAERAWRAAKQPHPLGRRLKWAAEALEAAMAKEEAHRAELAEFEEEYARRRTALLARQDADVARTARKQEALDELRMEARPAEGDADVGARATAAAKEVRPTLWAARVALEGIQEDVGPALEKALYATTEGSATWEVLQGALSSVTSVFNVLQGAVRCKDEADQYDMARDDGMGYDAWEGDSLDEISLPEDADIANRGRRGERAWKTNEAGDNEGAKRRALEGASPPAARWTRARNGGEGAWTRSDDGDGAHGVGTTTGGSSGRPSMGGSSADHLVGTATSGGKTAPGGRGLTAAEANEATAAEVAEHRRKAGEAEQRRAAEEAAERTRLAQSYSAEERAQAESLHAQQAAAANAGFGSEHAQEIARRIHQQRVDEIVKLARERDIPVDLQEMRGLTSEDLEDWARRHV